MPNWKKLIVSGSDALLNSLTVSTTGRFDDDLTISGSNSSLILKGDGSKFARLTHNASGLVIDGGVQNQYISIGSPTWSWPNGVRVYGDLQLTGSAGGTATFEGSTQSTVNLKTTTNSKNNYLVGTTTGDISFRPDGTESVFLKSDGKVGIGFNSLVNQLDVNGVIMGTGIRFGSQASGEGIMRVNGTGNGNGLAFTTGNFSSNYVALYVDHSSNNGKVGIGTTAPTKQLQVIGDISGSDIFIDDWNSVSSSLSTLTQNQTLNTGGTVNYVARFESADTITTGIIRDDGSTVGINAAPSANKTLYIDGTIQATGEAFFSHLDIIGSGGNSRIRDDVQLKFGTNRVFGIQYNSSGDYLEFTSGSSNLVTVKGNGNVGIGTTSPDRDLHVRASAIVSTKLEGTNAGHLLDLVNSNASPTYNGIRFTQGTTSKMAVTHIADGTTKGYVQIGNSWGAGSEILVVDGRTSRVGIGTTSPTAELQVAGDVIVDGTITAQEFHTEFVSASIIYESGSTKFGDTSEDIHSFSGSLRVTGSGNHYFTHGNVGIGTTSPGEKLTVKDGAIITTDSSGVNYAKLDRFGGLTMKGNGAGARGIQTPNTDALTFGTNGTERIRISSAGALKFNSYGSGNNTGTLAYTLGLDSSGNVIEFTGGSGGSVSSITSGADTRVAYFNGSDSLEGSANFTWDDSQLTIVGDVEAEEFIGDLRGAVLFKAQAGEALSKGDVVYISGISGNTTIVSKADADDANKMPAFGIAAAAASSNNPIDIYTSGILSGLNTSGFSIGDELFVSSSAGELTSTRPTGESSLLQKIAKVTRVDNAAGSIFITGAGRTNAVPNLNTGRLFVGNASNQAVADGTIHVDIANSKVGIGTDNPIYKLQIAGSTYVNNGTLFLDSNRSLMWGNSNQGIKAVNDSNLIFRTGGSEQMFLTAGGNVGIGTSNVSRINSTSTFFQPDEDGRFLVMNHNSGSFIMLETNANGGGDQVGGIFFNKVGNQSDAHIHVAGIDAVLVDHATDALDGGELRFFTKVAGAGDTSHHMLLDAGGNLGIGQGIDPAAKLHIDAGSSDEVARFVSSDNKAYIRISDDDTTGYISSENGLFSLGRNAGVNAANININASHNVGIGTSTPGAKLDVHGRVDFANDLRLRGTDSAADQGVVRFYVNSNNELTIDTANNGNNKFVIDEGGQVGINTSSPSRTLDVNGEIQNNGIFRKGGNVIIKSTGSETMFGPGGSGIITFHNSATMTTSDETMRIDANGNLLLNNTSAGARLDIREDTNYAIRAEDASGHYFRVNTGGDVDMRGDLTVQGIITAQEFHTEFVSASIVFQSGSTKFGDTTDDNHDFTGSVNVSGSMVLTDNTKLQLGSNTTAGDLRIFHNGTTSKIANNTGNLEITQFVDDGDIKFISDDGSGGTTEYFRVDGGNRSIVVSAALGMYFNDGVAGRFGDDGDMHLYHDGSNSVINNTTGHLQIYNNADDGDIQFISDNGSGGTAEYFRVDGGQEMNIFTKKVGIGTTSTSRMLHVVGSTEIDGALFVEAANNQVRLVDSDSSGNFSVGVNTHFQIRDVAGNTTPVTIQAGTPGNTLFLKSDGKVGIGTGNPSEEVHIVSTSPGVRLQDSDGTNTFGRVHYSGASLYFYSRNNTSNGNYIWIGSNGTTDTEFMRINSSGNVGIGTASPASKLHVSSSTFNDHITLGRDSDELGITVSGGQVLVEGGLSPFTNDNQDLGRSDKHWQDLYITDNIYVSQSAVLGLAGGLNATGDLSGSDVHIDDWGSVSASLSAIQQAGGVNGTGTAGKLPKWSDSDTLTDSILSESGTTVTVGSAGSGVLQLGSIGFLSGASTSIFDIYSPGDIRFNADSNNNGNSSIIFQESGNEKMRITSDGKVGIGTTSPDSLLHVAADVSSANTGTITIEGRPTGFLGDDIATIDFHNNGSKRADIRMERGNTATDSQLVFSTSDAGTLNDVLIINEAGNVGIGTDNPGASLHVASITNDFVAKFSHTTATGYAPGSILLQAGQHASRGQGLFHYNTEADDSWFTGVPYNVNSTKWIVAHKPDTTFNPDVAQLSHAIFTIDSATDNVGIGESSPLTRLHVKVNDTGGTNSVYGVALIEKADAQLDLLSTKDGTWGSAINLIEASGSGVNTDVWSIARKTTNGNGDSSLNFNFGTANQHDNSFKFRLSAAGVATVASNLTTYGSLTVGDSTSDSATIGLKHLLGYCENTDVDTGTETVKELALSVYQAVFFDYVVKNGTNLRAGTVTAVHDGTNVEYTDTSTKDLGDTSAVTLSVDISGSNMRLRATTTSDNWIVKANIRGIKV